MTADELSDAHPGFRQSERAYRRPAVTAAGLMTTGVLAAPLVLRICLVAAFAVGAFLRVWNINALGYNSDEAVYAGQGAALANDPELTRYFPIIRAHPMVFQFILALTFEWGVNDLAGRLVSVAIGLLTIFLVYRIGALLYGEQAGVIAAVIMSLMPYHVIVTRQVLLDGPATFCTTLTLYLVTKFASTGRPAFLAAAGTGLGLTFMTKETGFVMFAAVYAFLALTPQVRLRIRDITVSIACMLAVMILYPISLALAGGGASDKAQGYLVWQLFRRPNHTWDFYPTVVPPSIGFAVLAAAVGGFWLLQRERSWRETLLLAWIVVPCVVFQLWPVKGFQYLLPTAPAIALLAARTLSLGFTTPRPRWPRWAEPGKLQVVAVAVVAISLAIPAWGKAQPSRSTEFLAGSGGVPGGRELGEWIQENIPEDALFLTVGPSMANIVQFYGHRRAYGLSVSPNPLHRNPSYEPVYNPDYLIRNSELQYLVYDTFSASRTVFFGDKMLGYAEKYNGRIVHQEYVVEQDDDGTERQVPVITIYEVRPGVNMEVAPPESAEPSLSVETPPDANPRPGGPNGPRRYPPK